MPSARNSSARRARGRTELYDAKVDELRHQFPIDAALKKSGLSRCRMRLELLSHSRIDSTMGRWR
jgi:hypothetical protein